MFRFRLEQVRCLEMQYKEVMRLVLLYKGELLGMYLDKRELYYPQ